MDKKTKLVCTVTNDLNYDQRMQKICTSLFNAGYDVLLVGRTKKNSKPLKNQIFKQNRIPCFFQKGKLFYIEYNIRLFFLLLFTPFDVVNAIDLDTIVPCTIAAQIKNKKKVFDAHELFTEMEEVVNRKWIKKTWEWVENTFIKKYRFIYTISEEYAKQLAKITKHSPTVIQNSPPLSPITNFPSSQKSYILYQGAVNKGRGLEALFESMRAVNHRLVVCGEGDISPYLKEQIETHHLHSKIDMRGYVLPSDLEKITLNAGIGMSIFSDNGLSNRYSLCNRFFNYMHNGLPQITSAYPEYIKINAVYPLSFLIAQPNSAEITIALNELLKNETLYQKMKENALKARQVYNWNEEEKKLIDYYTTIVAS